MINKRKGVGINNLKDPKVFIEYSNDMHDFYKNINEYNPDKENKILVVCDDMIADMIHNKKLNSIVTELFIRGRKLNISLVFISQLYFKVPKDARLNTSHFFIAKIPNKRELHQIAINHSSEISTKDFANIYRKCTNKPYSFLVIDTMLASNNLLRFRKNIFNIKCKFLECNSIIQGGQRHPKMSLFFFGNNFYKNKETFRIFSPQILEVYRILLMETTLESIRFWYTFSVINTMFVLCTALLYDSTAVTPLLKLFTALLSISCVVRLIPFLMMSSLVCQFFSQTLSFKYPLRK